MSPRRARSWSSAQSVGGAGPGPPRRGSTPWRRPRRLRRRRTIRARALAEQTEGGGRRAVHAGSRTSRRARRPPRLCTRRGARGGSTDGSRAPRAWRTTRTARAGCRLRGTPRPVSVPREGRSTRDDRVRAPERSEREMRLSEVDVDAPSDPRPDEPPTRPPTFHVRRSRLRTRAPRAVDARHRPTRASENAARNDRDDAAWAAVALISPPRRAYVQPTRG